MQGIVTSFMQLNRMFRYSLLHKRIIHTTLLFHRAFLAANWSWLSCIHNNLWNGSWIVINSSFQSLVIHNITCTHLIAFMQYITTVAPLPTFLELLSSANMYKHDTFLYSNIHMVWGLLPLPLHGIVIINSYLHGSYLHPFHDQFGWSLQRLQNLLTNFLLWTRCLIPFFIGLLVTFIGIGNILNHVQFVVGFSTNANTNAIVIISGSL